MNLITTLTHVLYGCENQSLTLREGRGGMGSGKGVLRKVQETYRLDVTGDWRKLHKKELGNLPKIIKE